MMRLIGKDLLRALRSPLFWLSVALLVASSWNDSHRAMPFLLQYTSHPGALNYFLRGTVFSAANTVSTVVPLLACLPFGLAYQDDVTSGFLKGYYMRANVRAYVWSRYLSTACIGGMVFLVAHLLFLLGCYIYDPTPSIDMSLVTSNYATGWAWGWIYDYTMWGYIVVYLAQCFLFGAAYSILCMGISGWLPNKYIALLFPVLFFHCTLLLAWILPRELVYFVKDYFPGYSYDLLGRTGWIVLYKNIFTLTLGSLLYFLHVRSWRNGRWVELRQG